MATILNTEDVLTVRVEYTSEGNNKAFNILHYSLKDVDVAGGGLFPGESMFDVGPLIAQEFFAALSPTWAETASGDVKMTAVTVQNIWPTPKSRQYTYTVPDGGLPGNILGDPLPLQDAVTLIKQGETASRKDLGRVFVPGVSESGQDAGILTAGQVTLYQTMAAAWSNIVPVTSGIYTLNFYPVLFNPAEVPEPVQRPVMEVVLSDNIIKTQRRRRPGKGI